MLRNFLICFLLILPLASFAAGQQLTRYEYQQLSVAFKLIEEGKWSQARQQLNKAKDVVKSDYAKALVWHNLAQVSLQTDQYSSAITNLQKALALKALPEQQQFNLQHTLGQLYCMQEQWKNCIKTLKSWLAASPDSVKPNDHLLLAQAYAQLEQWKNLLPHITTAIRSKKVAPESWYQLKVVAHIQLKQWRKAAQQQQVVLNHYSSKPANWRHLVSLQIQSGQEKKALATQRLGYQRELLLEASDYILLSQLLMNEGAPFQAGQVLAQGIDAKIVKSSPRNLRTLSQAWVMAKETARAVKTLKRLYRLDSSLKNAELLAQMQMQASSWDGAEKTLLSALSKASKAQPKIQLMLGVARLNMKRYEAAREAFIQAGNDSRYEKTVSHWIRYLDQVSATNKVRG